MLIFSKTPELYRLVQRHDLDGLHCIIKDPHRLAAEQDNLHEAFSLAVFRGYHDMVSSFLEVKYISEHESEYFIDLLEMALDMGHLKIVQLMLTLNKVRDHLNQLSLQNIFNAASSGHMDCIACLAEYPQVKARLGFSENAEASDVISWFESKCAKAGRVIKAASKT